MEFTADWFTHNIKEWSSLLSHFKNEVCSILDIGCFEGRSTLWFLESIPKSMVTAVDIFKETEEYKKHGGYEHDYLSIFKGNIDAYKDRVDVCVGYSFYVLQDLIKDNRRYDIIYVDGSHLPINVLQDMILSWELLNVGGIMICDDYDWKLKEERPRTAMNAFLNVYAGKYEIIDSNHNRQLILKKTM